MKRSDAIEYVASNARYSPDAPVEPYFVRFPTPFSGKVFFSNDTSELVEKIIAYCRTKDGLEKQRDGRWRQYLGAERDEDEQDD